MDIASSHHRITKSNEFQEMAPIFLNVLNVKMSKSFENIK